MLSLSLEILLLLFSCWVQLFATLWTAFTSLPCPSLSPRVCSNSYPVSQWCYLTISSSAGLFSFCLQSFPASGYFPMSRRFTSGGQSIRTSASASVLSMNIQGWFPLGFTSLISLLFKGFSRVFSSTTIQKQHFFSPQSSLWSNSHICTMTTGKSIALTIQTFFSKVMSLLFNMLSRLVIAFLPRSKCLLISWLRSPSTVILESKKIKICHCFHLFPSYLPWSDGTGCHDVSFLNVEF